MKNSFKENINFRTKKDHTNIENNKSFIQALKSHAEGKTDEAARNYQYCLDLDSTDNDQPVCFADANNDSIYELDFTFTANDLNAELSVKRIVDPADAAIPFRAVDQSFEITVNSNYKIDGTINVTGVNIDGVPAVAAQP